jgi:hypothetical protein
MGKNSSKEHVNEIMNGSVAESTNVATVQQTISKLGIAIQTPFIDAEAYIADPYALLGQVMAIRKKGDACPESIVDANFPVELCEMPVPHIVNENSKLKKPELRNSIMVDKHLAANVSFLSYLSVELDANSSFSLMVFDQAAGLIDMRDTSWEKGLKEWKEKNTELLTDPEICYLFVITGFIQKNVVRKKYIKYDGKSKGGAFGVNIGGQLSTSTEEYSLDVKFGLTPVVLKRPDKNAPVTRGIAMKRRSLTKGGAVKKTTKAPAIKFDKPTKEEVMLFNSTVNFRLSDKLKRNKKNLNR